MTELTHILLSSERWGGGRISLAIGLVRLIICATVSLFRSVIHVHGDGAAPFVPPVRKIGNDRYSRWLTGAGERERERK